MKFSKSFFTGMICLLTLTQALSASAGQKERKGALIGGLIGGLIGNNNGHGNAGSVIAGAIIGSAIGATLAHELSDDDRRAVGRSRQDCLEGRRNSEWRGSGQAYGSINIIQDGYYRDNQSVVCRSYESTIYSRGRSETTRGYACRDNYGNWNEVRETEVVFNGGYQQPSPPPPPMMSPQMPPPMIASDLQCIPQQGMSALLINRRMNRQVSSYMSMRSCQIAVQNSRGPLVCVEARNYQSWAIDTRTGQAVGYSYPQLNDCIRSLRR